MTSEAMMRDDARLEQMRATLAVDGYHLSVDEAGSGFDVRITADPGTCADCLIPKQAMASMLQAVLGVDRDAIRLSYPGDADDGSGPDLTEKGA
ncbi:hypothetical protein [Actinomadura sp. 3N407]|uniref:hypothetical protein n=1 Tax=Actinomadura sp. 3N407 TaxID=3457423 RepID=UPI003FCD2E35